MFDVDLKNRYEEKIGYKLFKDYGELECSYRVGNEIIDPVSGVYRMRPMIPTAIPNQLIGIVSAEVTLFAVPAMVQTVLDKLNRVCTELNGTSFFLKEDGITYAVSYSCQTATVGEQARLSHFNGGEGFPIYQTVTYTIVKNGMPASDIRLKIDGHEVPILSLVEIRAHTSSVYADETARGTYTSEISSFGIEFNVPILSDDALSSIFDEHLLRDQGNRALCVELTKAGKSRFYLMGIMKVTESVVPLQNVGSNISLAELNETVAIFNGLWTIETKTGTIPTWNGSYYPITSENDVVFWGDGEAEIHPQTMHVYTDGKSSHTVLIFSPSESERKEVSLLDSLQGVTLYAGAVLTANLKSDTFFLLMGSEGIIKRNGRICLFLLDADGVNGSYYPIDKVRSDGRLGFDEGHPIRISSSARVTKYTGEIPLHYYPRDIEKGVS